MPNGDPTASEIANPGNVSDRERVAFLLLLFAADDLPELAAMVGSEAGRRFQASDFCLIWTLGTVDANGLQRFSAPARTDGLCDEAFVIAALRGENGSLRGSERAAGIGSIFTLPSPRPNLSAALYLAFPAEQQLTPLGLLDFVQAVGWRCRELLDRAYLKRSVDRLEKAEQLQHALYAIADLASADLEMPEMLRSLHQIVGELMYAENFYISLLDEPRQGLRFIYFADSVDQSSIGSEQVFPFTELQNSLTLAFIRYGKVWHGPSEQLRQLLDVTRDEEYGPEALDWLGVPLASGEQVLGALVVQSYLPDVGYTDEDAALLGYVAQHILTALQRKQAQEDLERRVDERTHALTLEITERKRGEQLQTALYKIAELASTSETLDAFYRAAHQIVGELLDAKNFFVALIEPNDTLSFPYAVDERDPLARFGNRKIGTGITEYVIRTGKPLRADRRDLDALNAAGETKSFGTLSVCWLGVPLKGESGLLGVMAVQSYTESVMYTERDQAVLTFVSHHIALALERKRAQDSIKLAYADLEARVQARTHELNRANSELRAEMQERERIEQQLKFEALHDTLTGLPNRTLLLDRLADALERFQLDPTHRFAVLFLDLDRFKVINDSVGHLIGDELLKEVGARVRACLREDDLIARLGGDEFALLLADIGDQEEPLIVARRVIAALNESIRVEGKELFTSTSIGIAYSDARYHRAEELLRDADVAMYRAKTKGRQRFEIFDEGLHREALALLDLEGDLRRAMTREEFEPYFQAIYELDTGLIVGYEALMRWHHPERGLLLPGDFLKVAEENGSAELIDWQIFHQVAKALPRVCQAEHQYVTINVSARHFRDPDLCQQLLDLLDTYQVPARRLRIEVTEGALLENPELICRTLDALRVGGVLTVLDDFGTGYSSLSYLHQFPMHSLKIDRSFVADLKPGHHGGNSAVVRAIMALAKSLGVEVIAEGIETEAQKQALLDLGCLRGQGFLLAEPRPIGAWV